MKKIIGVVILLLFFLGFQELQKDSKALEFGERNLLLTENSVHEGSLLLINQETMLQSVEKDLAKLPEDFAANVEINDEYLLSPIAIDSLQKMFFEAEKDGIHHFKINSAYRNHELQQQLYEKYGADYALPAGYSEHQSGLSLDIASTQDTMDKATEGEWLANHAHKFGFILRYPEDKTEITGIAFEPWHFRYVGIPHSIIMKKKHFVLEEYIQFIQKKETFNFRYKGVDYVIQYAKEGEEVKVPDVEAIDISGDNLSGYIITSILKEANK